MAKKKKIPETDLTPKDVFGNKVSDDVLNSLDNRDDSKKVSSSAVFAKGALVAALALVLIMAIVFALSYLFSGKGSFVIKTIGPNGSDKLISLSETEGFSNSTTTHKCKQIDKMDNIPLEWLPSLDELGKDGSRNGDNYLAYTFYIMNSGKGSLDYNAKINITGETKQISKAIRVMVIHDGVPEIYARSTDDGASEAFPTKEVIEKVFPEGTARPEGCLSFPSDKVAYDKTVTDMEEGKVEKHTVVVWLEGEDPECVNDVLGGVMNLEMNFEVLDED
jgi:hypothetical protein